MKKLLIAMCVAGAALVAGGAASAQPETYDPAPWLEDLAELKSALSSHYSHLEWAVEERGADLPMAWSMAQQRLKAARSEAEAREIFDRFLEYFGDGHLKMDWSKASATGNAPALPSIQPASCASLGFRQRKDNSAVGARMPGYQALGTAEDAIFPAGIVTHEGKRIGVLRIQLFSYDIHPALCEEALKALAIKPEAPCDEACGNAVHEKVDTLFHAAFVRQVKALADARPDVLLVDIAGNGGGAEWAEAAMRVLTPVPIRSLDFGMVRHPHWLKQLDDQDRELAAWERQARGADKALLRSLRTKIVEARTEVATPCDMNPLWEGRKPACSMLVIGAGTAGGLLGSGRVKDLRKHPWGASLLNAASYDFEEGVWDGPLVILVDQKTASASVQFAGTLQGNKTAIVMGAPTMASGCGFTWGGIETRLKNSGGKVHIPDCARIRPDGSDDNGGVEPDVLVGFRALESERMRAGHVLRRLPEALEAAERLHAERVRQGSGKAAS